MTDRTPVLVVGAGPAGLVVACELLRHGVEVRVIDASPVPGEGSRAILLWPPAQEVLGQLGVLDEALRRGVRARAMAYHMGSGGGPLRVELDEADQPLLLPQERTGALLLDALHRLGGKVERPVRLTGVEQDADGITAHVTGPDGRPGAITADWLIGADGLGSAVRRELGIDFPGENISTAFLLAEGELSGEIDRSQMTYYLGSGTLLLAPLPDGIVRLSGPVPEGVQPTQELAQRLLDERGPGGLRMRVTTGAWVFHSQERIAAKLRDRRAFLVGDAAHVHSVVGGQGLNLGVADGRNLAWKLSGVISGRLSPTVLDSYDPERRSAAEQVVKATGAMAKQAVAGPAAARVRNVLWTLAQRTGVLRRWYGPLLAGRRWSGPDVLFGTPWSVLRGKGRVPRALPRAGARVPDALAAPACTHLRLITSAELRAAAGELGARLPGVVVLEPARDRIPSGFVLVRPDGVVAASGGTAEDLAAAGRALDRLAAH